jgi:hypothetical protein
MQPLPIFTAAAQRVLPDAPIPTQFAVRVRVMKTPRQSRGRTFLRRTAAVQIIGPRGFVIRELHFDEGESVSSETALANPRVRTALGEFGVDPAAVTVIE